MNGPVEVLHQQQQFGAVTLEDLKLDDEENVCCEQDVPDAPFNVPQVHSGVLKDLDKDEQLDDRSSKFCVALPKFQRISVDLNCSSIELPAPYLQARLASVQQQAIKQQQQLLQQGAAWAELLPCSSGSAMTVDVQLVWLSVEQHPQGLDAVGIVGVVQRLSKIIPGCGELTADGHGHYRCVELHCYFTYNGQVVEMSYAQWL
jgi:hypothetical protein